MQFMANLLFSSLQEVEYMLEVFIILISIRILQQDWQEMDWY